MSDRHARSPKAGQRSPIAKKEERVLLSQRSNYRTGASSKPKFGSTTRDSSNGRRTENKVKTFEMSFKSQRGESKLDPIMRQSADFRVRKMKKKLSPTERVSRKSMQLLHSMNSRIVVNEKKKRKAELENMETPNYPVNPAYKDLIQSSLRRNLSKAVQAQKKKTILFSQKDAEIENYERKQEEIVNKSIYQFKMNSPIPADEKLKEKFKFFYKSYNYNANTKCHMTYDGLDANTEGKTKMTPKLYDYCVIMRKHNE